MSPPRRKGGRSDRGQRGAGGRSGQGGGRGKRDAGGRPGQGGTTGRGGQAQGGRRPPPTRVTTRVPSGQIPAGRRGRVSSTRGLGGDQVEGRQAVRELLLAGRRKVREVWLADQGDDAAILADIRDLAADNRVTVTAVSRARLAARARSEAPQGVLALAAPLPEADLDELVTPSAGSAGGSARQPFLVALDGVTDPGNLGAILRSAECAGVTGAVLPRHRAVHVTPAATKAAAGAIEHVPIAVAGGLPSAIAQMRSTGVHVVGLDGSASRSLYDMAGADGPVCVVLGAEGRGLSRLVRERCDEVVAIPMVGALGSLNVAAAAALACFEVARRR